MLGGGVGGTEGDGNGGAEGSGDGGELDTTATGGEVGGADAKMQPGSLAHACPTGVLGSPSMRVQTAAESIVRQTSYAAVHASEQVPGGVGGSVGGSM